MTRPSARARHVLDRALARARREPVLTGILAVACVLRALPILWGLPIDPAVQSYHPDEWKLFRTTADFPQVYVTDDRWVLYGTSVTYTLGALLAPVKVLLVAGLGMERAFDGVVQLASRAVGVLLGTASVLLLYVLARRLFGRTTGLVAAAFLATSFYSVLNAPLGTLDVPMAFLLLATLLAALEAARVPTLRRHVVLGVLAGLLVGTKVTAFLVFVVPAMLTLTTGGGRVRADPTGRDVPIRRRAGLLAVAIAVAVGVFALYQPHVFLEPGRYVKAYREAEFNWVVRLSYQAARTPLVWLESSVRALGAPIAALAVAGAPLALRRRRRDVVALLTFLALYYLTWRWFLLPRYVIPVAPLFCLLAAVAVGALAADRRRIVRAVGVAALAVSLGWSLALCAGGIEARLRDPRPDAARFLARAVTPGSTLAFSATSERYDWTRSRWHYPKVDPERVRIVPAWQEPDVVVTSSNDLRSIERALRSDALLPGFVWDPARRREWYNYAPPSPRLFRFYARLLDPDGPYELVRTFAVPVRAPVEFPPPETRVYRRRSTAVTDASSS